MTKKSLAATGQSEYSPGSAGNRINTGVTRVNCGPVVATAAQSGDLSFSTGRAWLSNGHSEPNTSQYPAARARVRLSDKNVLLNKQCVRLRPVMVEYNRRATAQGAPSTSTD